MYSDRKIGGRIPTTTIRLDHLDIEIAKNLAKDKGMHYQTYIKALIHIALLKNKG
jgi:predicted DNA binding CopG/RHH family protein